MKTLFATLIACVLALPAWAEIDIQEVTSESGIKAWLVEDHSIPFTALELRFRGGTSLDDPDSRGAVYLMSGLIEEGAGDMDARTYARELESLAASIGYNAGDDTVSISAQFLTENRDAVVDLLRTTIHEPRFDPDAIERVKGQILSGLKSDQTDPNDIASQSFSAMAYGDHPYGSDGKGTIESVSALTRDDVTRAYDGVFARDRLYVAAVGDITARKSWVHCWIACLPTFRKRARRSRARPALISPVALRWSTLTPRNRWPCLPRKGSTGMTPISLRPIS